MPTEGVWGLSCNPHSSRALNALVALKRRPDNLGFVLVSHSESCFEAELAQLAPEQRARVSASWPGPHTWLVPNMGFPDSTTAGNGMVAVRVTAHRVLAELCQHWGKPLVSTSANLHGLAPLDDIHAIRAQFGTALGAIVPGELGGLNRPTSLRNAINGETLRE